MSRLFIERRGLFLLKRAGVPVERASVIWLILGSTSYMMLSVVSPGGIDYMMNAPARPRFSDRLISRRGAWISVGLAVLMMAVLFGVFGGAEAPARTGLAAERSESAQASELMARFPNADRQSVVVVASREDGADLSSVDMESLAELLPVLGTHVAEGLSGPVISDDGVAAMLVIPITVGVGNTEMRTVIVPAIFSLIGDRVWWPGTVLRVLRGPQPELTRKLYSGLERIDP